MRRHQRIGSCLGIVVGLTLACLIAAPSASALLRDPNYWRSNPTHRHTVYRFVWQQAPQPIPTTYDPVSGPSSSLTSDFRRLPTSNATARQLFTRQRLIGVAARLVPGLGAAVTLYMAADAGWQLLQVGRDPSYVKQMQVYVPGSGAGHNQHLQFFRQGEPLQTGGLPMPYDGWAWTQWAQYPNSGTGQNVQMYEDFDGDCGPVADYLTEPPVGFEVWSGGTSQCTSYYGNPLPGTRTPHAAYTPEDALVTGPIKPHDWSPTVRTLPEPPTPGQAAVERTIDNELEKPENAELRQWINFHLGSPGETDPTGTHPDRPDIDFPAREEKREKHGHKFDDPYGPNREDLDRYWRDAADIVKRKENGSDTLRKCVRTRDNATVYWDPERQAVVIVRDGVIQTYFPPDRNNPNRTPYEYFTDFACEGAPVT